LEEIRIILPDHAKVDADIGRNEHGVTSSLLDE
jgi:hypothetical protein